MPGWWVGRGDLFAVLGSHKAEETRLIQPLPEMPQVTSFLEISDLLQTLHTSWYDIPRKRQVESIALLVDRVELDLPTMKTFKLTIYWSYPGWATIEVLVEWESQSVSREWAKEEVARLKAFPTDASTAEIMRGSPTHSYAAIRAEAYRLGLPWQGKVRPEEVNICWNDRQNPPSVEVSQVLGATTSGLLGAR